MLNRLAETDPDLLAGWRWLVGERARAFAWSTAGDVFFSDPDGCVHQLDTGGGEVERIADSLDAFDLLMTDPAIANEWLLLPVVRAYVEAHGALQPGTCLGFRVLPVFKEGSYGAENRFSLQIKEHCDVTGEIHHQIRNLPDGAKVQFKIVP